MKSVVKVEIKKMGVDEFNEVYEVKKVVAAEQWDEAQAIVLSTRWGNTQYMSSVGEETCGYGWRPIYKMG